MAWASRDVLLSLPGFNEQIVDRFLEFRRGPDGIDGTAEDPPIENAQAALAFMGLSADQSNQVLPLTQFKDKVYRVVSVGKSRDAARTVQMIIRKTGIPQLISWKEL